MSSRSLAVNYLFLTNDGGDPTSGLTVEEFNAVDEQNDYEVCGVCLALAGTLSLLDFSRFRGHSAISLLTTGLRTSLPKNLRSSGTPSTIGRPRRPFFATSNASCSRYSVSPPSRAVRSGVDYDEPSVHFLHSRCFAFNLHGPFCTYIIGLSTACLLIVASSH